MILSLARAAKRVAIPDADVRLWGPLPANIRLSGVSRRAGGSG